MMHKVLFSLVLFLALNAVFGESFAEPACDSGWTEFGDEKCYYVVPKLMTWEEANTACKGASNGSRMVAIKFKDEQDFIEDLLFKKQKLVDNVWIGTKRLNNKSEFRWTDGTKVEYSRWAAGGPSKDDTRSCVEMVAMPQLSSPQIKSNRTYRVNVGDWDNINCRKHNLVICEKAQKIDFAKLTSMFFNLKKTYIKEKNEMKDIIFNQGTEITTLKNKEAAAEKSIADLKTKETAAENAIKKLQTDLTAAQKLVTDLKAKEAAAEKSIAELKTKEAAAEKAIADLKTKEAGAENAIKKLQTDLVAAQKLLTDLKTKEAAAEKNIAKLQTDLTASLKVINDVKAKEANAEKTIAKQQTDITDLKKKESASQTSIAALNKKATELETLAVSVPNSTVYIQYPNEVDPNKLWKCNKGTWVDVSKTYANVFFRVTGDKASPLGQVQAESVSAIDEIKYVSCKASDKKNCPVGPYDVKVVHGNWSPLIYVSNTVSGAAVNYNKIQFHNSPAETRPRNMAVKVWRCVAKKF